MSRLARWSASVSWPALVIAEPRNGGVTDTIGGCDSFEALTLGLPGARLLLLTGVERSGPTEPDPSRLGRPDPIGAPSLDKFSFELGDRPDDVQEELAVGASRIERRIVQDLEACALLGDRGQRHQQVP
jgi:hypothetical protein